MTDSLASSVAKHRWWHSIDLGGGLVTPGHKSPILHQRESAALFDQVDLAGMSVLDIGAWNGYYSFEAWRRGASRVLATDSYCWTHPDLLGRETFDLANAALGAGVEAKQIDASDITPASVGTFDAVLFLGVFYHRYDALDALARAASVAGQLLVVETHLDLREIDRPAMAFYPNTEAGGDDTNWWGPNALCMVELLRGHGFVEIDVATSPAEPPELVDRNRGIFHAWRSTAARRGPPPPEPVPPPSPPPPPAPPRLPARDRIVREIKRPFRRLMS